MFYWTHQFLVLYVFENKSALLVWAAALTAPQAIPTIHLHYATSYKTSLW